jgi:hypothetical protein
MSKIQIVSSQHIVFIKFKIQIIFEAYAFFDIMLVQTERKKETRHILNILIIYTD